MTDAPNVLSITRSAGVAGQYALTVRVQYAGEAPETVTFVGSTYGGPIVMITPAGTQVFVSRDVTDRIGEKLDAAWVRAFFAPKTDDDRGSAAVLLLAAAPLILAVVWMAATLLGAIAGTFGAVAQ